MADKTCKHCSMIIPSAAKICPHCRKNVGFYLTWPAKIFLIIVGFTLVSVIGSTIGSKTNQPVGNEQTKNKEANPIISENPLTEKGTKVKAKHPEWSNQECNDVADKAIRLGMTVAQAKAAWGAPDKINETVGRWGQHEQWVYRKINSYVYFENGTLTSWSSPGSNK